MSVWVIPTSVSSVPVIEVVEEYICGSHDGATSEAQLKMHEAVWWKTKMASDSANMHYLSQPAIRQIQSRDLHGYDRYN